jgi:hypothetical protein
MDEMVEIGLDGPAYRLSEDAHIRLHELRDELLLMSTLAFAATTKEEETPLEIRRGMLGKYFEHAALKIDSLLLELTRLPGPVDKTKRH